MLQLNEHFDVTEPTNLVLVNGPEQSVQSPRARALFGEDSRIVFKDKGRFGSIGGIRQALREFKGAAIYCIDLGFPSAPLAAVRRGQRPSLKLVYELGDPARPLSANQERSRLEVFVADQMDRRLPLRADQRVFRGSYLAEYFEKLLSPRSLPPWIWIPDGVDCRESDLAERIQRLQNSAKTMTWRARSSWESLETSTTILGIAYFMAGIWPRRLLESRVNRGFVEWWSEMVRDATPWRKRVLAWGWATV